MKTIVRKKNRQLFRLGCAALATMLAVGCVPFLRGWAAEDDAAVSGSDIVKQSDMTNETHSVSSSDAASAAEENEAKADNDGAVVLSETVAPKYRGSSVFNWVKANTVTDFDNAAHGSNSRIGYYSGVTNWLHSSGQAFAEAQGLDYRKCYFLTFWDGSRFIAAYKDQPSSVVTTGYKNASEFETLVNNGVTFFYVPYTETEDISFANAVYEVNVDETISICPTFTPAWSNDLVTWESSDPAVASVVYRPSDIRKADGSCQVTGLGAGITTLTATVNGHTVTCQVAVSGESFSGISTISDWSRATKEEDLANAKTISEEYLADWYDEWCDANKRKFFSLDGKKFMGSQIYFVQSYIADPAYPGSEQISYFYNGYPYSQTQYVAGLNLTNKCVMYIPKSDLSFTYHAAVEPTCTEAGSIAYWTAQDGEKFADANRETSLTDEEIPVAATGHTWGEWTETTPATCTQPGEETRTCQRDPSHTETRPIDALGHTWGEWTETTAPSCAAPGEETRTCQNDPSHTETREVAAPGHDWSEWATVTEATETTPGEEKRSCGRCHTEESRVIPARGPDDYEFTADSGQTWTKGSTDSMVVIIKDTNGDDTQTFEKLVSVSVDGTKLTRDVDYTAESGSIKLTLSPDYLSTLDAGKHTLTVELTVTTLTYTFTVVAPATTDTPSTGEGILLISVSIVLMLLAAGGAAYVLIRRRKIAE